MLTDLLGGFRHAFYGVLESNKPIVLSKRALVVKVSFGRGKRGNCAVSRREGDIEYEIGLSGRLIKLRRNLELSVTYSTLRCKDVNISQ